MTARAVMSLFVVAFASVAAAGERTVNERAVLQEQVRATEIAFAKSLADRDVKKLPA